MPVSSVSSLPCRPHTRASELATCSMTPALGRARLWVRRPVGWLGNWLPTILVWLTSGVLPLPGVAGWEWLKRGVLRLK